MEFHPQLAEQQGGIPQQFAPGYQGFPGGGGGIDRRISQLERQMDQLNKQMERLDRRVSRIERQLGYNRPDYYDLPDHSEYNA
ncbi:hypothetical protein H9631_13195 [Bacillus sp. Sa1BUA2]|uniref:Uncharacterized protein n=2 Tax=Bacillus norwichensis TaxID=2762217 RepID=A0ABR8VMQ4_9BACI|nr:hypothetical protein [Bacillus norwichensis]